MLEAARKHLGGLLELNADPAGLHLIAGLSPALARQVNDLEIERIAAAADVVAVALSRFYARRPARQGVLLGYAAFDEGAIDQAARQLAAHLRPALERS